MAYWNDTPAELKIIEIGIGFTTVASRCMAHDKKYIYARSRMRTLWPLLFSRTEIVLYFWSDFKVKTLQLLLKILETYADQDVKVPCDT